MEPMTRRSFLTLSLRLATVMGLGASAAPALADALERIVRGRAPTLWLQGQCCSGCSVSLLDSEPVGADALLTRDIALAFHQTLSGATGHQAVETVDRAIAAGGFLLVVEGSVPMDMPQACFFGEEAFGSQLLRAARAAKAVVAVGTCATSGGIPAAEGNPTGAISVPEFLRRSGLSVPCISIPGCPAHPDWIVGTLTHVLGFGLPPLDDRGRPKAFFDKLVHDQCPRFADYEREVFAEKFSDDGCLFRLGCAGPITKADCNLRLWNGGTSSCIKAGAPCIGCAWEGFAAKRDFPFYLKNGQLQPKPKGHA